MKPGGQLAKSRGHELAVAVIFTKAYFPDGDGEFRRVPMSGGWDKRTYPGDLVCLKFLDKEGKRAEIDNSFPFSIECKHWNTKMVKHIFSGLWCQECQIFDWMDQAIRDSDFCKRIPLVVFKFNRTENFATMTSEAFEKLSLLFGRFLGKMYRVKRIEGEGASSIEIVIMLLKDLLEWVDWGVYKMAGATKYIRSLVPKEED